MKSRKKKRQNVKECNVCGWEVPRKGPYKDHCSLVCWAKDNGEDQPHETHDEIVPFEGYKVGE